MRLPAKILIILLFTSICVPNVTFATGPDDMANVSPQAESASWPMAGANPERTSWTPEEVRGNLKPVWYKPFEPYISQRVQVIAANNMLYISTARGLYALDAASGSEQWVYPTEFPLGHSPTIFENVAYVGGLDRKLHAIDAQTGQGLWTFETKAGFRTNPLVVDDKVYLGSRDGNFYAVYRQGHQNAGELAWKFETDGPIDYSAAHKDGVIFFASNDSHAYALDANSGALVWKSAKLPGAGFYSWWPVVYQNRVIFSGSNNYRSGLSPFPGGLAHLELDDVYPNHDTDPRGTFVGPLGTSSEGDWVTGTSTIDAGRILSYFAAKPWRKTVLILNRATGQEEETAPVLWTGNDGSGGRFPPVIGADGVLYQQNNYRSDPFIAGGQISGWQPGVGYISYVSSDWGAVDEVHAAAAGGNLVYWNLCCDRQIGAFDINIPMDSPLKREWLYVNYNLPEKVPGYSSFYNPHQKYYKPYATFAGPDENYNGVYGFHGDTNPPIPYNDKVYMHRGNAVIAFADTNASPTALPMAQTPTNAPTANITPLGSEFWITELTHQIQKLLNAGHLRPGYLSHGLFDFKGGAGCGDNLVDYWSNSSETIYTLLVALPYLSAEMQQVVKTYIQNEYETYPPYQYNHVGWRDGLGREAFDLPPDVQTDLAKYGPESQNFTFRNNGGWNGVGIWGRNPYALYVLWKYADSFGDAQNILDSSKNLLDELQDMPSDTVLLNMPSVHNAFIAGHIGYLELQKLAGQSESTALRGKLDRLLKLRVSNFSTDSAHNDTANYCRTLNIAANFMYMVPELADYLRQNALSKVQAALNDYEELAPYWFVSLVTEGYAENPKAPLFDSHSLFMAKALILQEPASELEKYIDVPAFARGDLYYIQKLVALLDKQGFALNVAPSYKNIDPGEQTTFDIEIEFLAGFSNPVTLDAAPAPSGLAINLQPKTINSPTNGSSKSATLTVTDIANNGTNITYSIPVTATSGNLQETIIVNLFVGSISMVYVPIISKE